MNAWSPRKLCFRRDGTRFDDRSHEPVGVPPAWAKTVGAGPPIFSTFAMHALHNPQQGGHDAFGNSGYPSQMPRVLRVQPPDWQRVGACQRGLSPAAKRSMGALRFVHPIWRKAVPRQQRREHLHHSQRRSVLLKHRTPRPRHASQRGRPVRLGPLPFHPAPHGSAEMQAFHLQRTARHARLVEQEICQRPASKPQQGFPRPCERDTWRDASRPDQGLAVHTQDHLAHPHAAPPERAQLDNLVAMQPGRSLAQGLHFEAVAERREPPAQRSRRMQPLAQYRRALGA